MSKLAFAGHIQLMDSCPAMPLGKLLGGKALLHQAPASLPNPPPSNLSLPYSKLLRLTDTTSAGTSAGISNIAKIPDLRSLYMFRDVESVSLFLTNYPFLITTLVG